MRTRLTTIIAMLALATSVMAQETYEGANIATEDLNGTARYVGMGGAMEALGADISTIGTNPAGIGMFRSSTASMSFGFVTQQGAESYSHGDETKMSFDQLGFVYSARTGIDSYMNFAFNYHKSRNFNQILNAANSLNGSSQNKLTANKDYWQVFDLAYYEKGDYSYYNSSDLSYSQADDLYENYLLMGDMGGYGADRFNYDFASKGYISEYDFNLSGNIHDRLYLGMTIGIHDVHYKNWSTYHEFYPALGDLYYDDYRNITGTGYDLKFGAIVRPIEESPFRIGVSIATPTWYDLTSSNYTAIQTTGDPEFTIENAYDYKFYTPWKFGLSLGHTVGNYLAIGASYEYANYDGCDARIDDGGYYEYDGWYGYDRYVDNSYSDDGMNQNIDLVLKGVSTFKLGLEYKLMPELALRCGYNYVSPMYSEDGYKDVSLNSRGVSYTSDPSFTNWKSTNRFTLGLGYYLDNLTVDLAYQYSATNGDFYAFTDSDSDYTGSTVYNIAPKTDVSNKRHQVLLTLGYRF